MGRPKIELQIGDRYGKLIVMEYIKITNKWKCLCDCGKIVFVGGHYIKRGKNSCGAYIHRDCSHPKLKDNLAAIRSDYSTYSYAAKKRKRVFELSIDQFKHLIIQDCFYCGAKPNSQRKMRYEHNFFRNGIDRLDNNKGYTLDNCVPCCLKCNWAKLDYNFKEWKEWVGIIYHKLFPEKNSTT